MKLIYSYDCENHAGYRAYLGCPETTIAKDGSNQVEVEKANQTPV